jgi:hypothetical protein
MRLLRTSVSTLVGRSRTIIRSVRLIRLRDASGKSRISRSIPLPTAGFGSRCTVLFSCAISPAPNKSRAARRACRPSSVEAGNIAQQPTGVATAATADRRYPQRGIGGHDRSDDRRAKFGTPQRPDGAMTEGWMGRSGTATRSVSFREPRHHRGHRPPPKLTAGISRRLGVPWRVPLPCWLLTTLRSGGLSRSNPDSECHRRQPCLPTNNQIVTVPRVPAVPRHSIGRCPRPQVAHQHQARVRRNDK